MNLAPGVEQYQRFYRIVTSQAVVGETVGIDHYARMIGLARDPAERLALLEDAWRERAHLRSMEEVARQVGVDPAIAEARRDPYWRQIRAAFDEQAAAGDLPALYVIQDVVLEAYALVLYEALAKVLEGGHGERAARIADDEAAHLAAGVRELAAAYAAEPERTLARVEFANERVARVLATWVQVDDCQPICGVCGMVGGVCAKEDLRAAGIDVEALQPTFADRYGDALRAAGLPPERVARWLARLFG